MSHPSNSATPTHAPATGSSSKSNWLKYALGGCGCVTLLVLGVLGVVVVMVGVEAGKVASKVADDAEQEEEARKVAEEFMDHLQEGRNEDAHALTTEEYRKSTSVGKLASWASTVRKIAQAKPRHFVVARKSKHVRNGKTKTYLVMNFEYREGRQRDVIRCPVRVLATTASKESSAEGSAASEFKIAGVECAQAHVSYRKAWGDKPLKGYEEVGERITNGWKKYKARRVDTMAAASTGAKLRTYLLDGKYDEFLGFFRPEDRKGLDDKALTTLAGLVRQHNLSKSEFSEWNMNLFDAWLAGGVGKSTYKVRLLDPTSQSGIRLVFSLARDHDFEAPEGKRIGPFYVTKLEMEREVRAQK